MENLYSAALKVRDPETNVEVRCFSFYSQKISTSNVVSSDDNDKDIDVKNNSSSSTDKTNR